MFQHQRLSQSNLGLLPSLGRLTPAALTLRNWIWFVPKEDSVHFTSQSQPSTSQSYKTDIPVWPCWGVQQFLYLPVDLLSTRPTSLRAPMAACRSLTFTRTGSHCVYPESLWRIKGIWQITLLLGKSDIFWWEFQRKGRKYTQVLKIHLDTWKLSWQPL